MPTHEFSDQEIFEKLQECETTYGKCTPRLFKQLDDTPEVSTVLRRFDSWKNAKQEAGILDLDSQGGRPEVWDDSQLLSHIRLVEDKLGSVSAQSMLEYKRQAKEDDELPDVASPSVIINRFGSWIEAKKKAGLDVPDDEHGDRVNNKRPRKFSNEEYLELLQECKDEYGKVTQRLFDEMTADDDDLPTASAVGKRFDSWSNAKQMAGVTDDGKSAGQQYSDDDLIEMLRACADEHETCTAKVFKEHYASPDVIRERFGSWNNGKEEAGLTPTESASYSDEELLDDLRTCKHRYGKCTAPIFNDDDEFPSATTVARRFGSWSDAKDEANLDEIELEAAA